MEFLEKCNSVHKYLCERCRSSNLQKLSPAFLWGAARPQVLNLAILAQAIRIRQTPVHCREQERYPVKVAIPTVERILDSQIDQRFGRAAYFVPDAERMDFRAIENESVADAGRASWFSSLILVFGWSGLNGLVWLSFFAHFVRCF